MSQRLKPRQHQYCLGLWNESEARDYLREQGYSDKFVEIKLRECREALTLALSRFVVEVPK